MFATKSVVQIIPPMAQTSGRLGNALTVLIITLALGNILCSCDGIKGHPDPDRTQSSSKSNDVSPNNLGKLFQTKQQPQQDYGHKTSLGQKRPTTSDLGKTTTNTKRTRRGPAQRRAPSQRPVAPEDSGATLARDGRPHGREEHERIVPSLETNGNSQVVYVNLARVVSDNKTEVERVIGGSRQPIKQEGQIGCGETNRNGVPSNVPTDETLQNRIVGGNKAEPGEFPYQVRLNIRSRRGSSLCGGVIIDKRHILTAAHCMTTW